MEPEKAKRPKYGGRKKGTPNKATTKFREALAKAMGGSIEEIPELLSRIEDPQKKLAAITNLLPYVAPKLQSVEVEANANVFQAPVIKWKSDESETEDNSE